MATRDELEEIATQLQAEAPELYTPYVASHRKRYIETACLLEGMPSGRILELGASWPWFFTRMLARRFPSAEIELAENRDPLDPGTIGEPPHSSHRVRCGASPDAVTPLHMRNFNIETEVWPYADESFDVVICMELLEHLLVDPYWIFAESRRLLRKGGLLVLTTPNVSSTEGVRRIVNGHAPYTFGVYSRYGGYGRHNREFAPAEIAQLGTAAGLRTETIGTCNVYPRRDLSDDLEESLLKLGARREFLGQTIFYTGIRDDSIDPTGHPSFLFNWDPNAWVADIRAAHRSIRANTCSSLELRLEVTNKGSESWQPGKIRLQGAWIGLDRHHVSHFGDDPFASPVSPGQTRRFHIMARTPDSPGVYRISIDLEQEGRGRFSNGASPKHTPLNLIVVVGDISSSECGERGRHGDRPLLARVPKAARHG